MPYNRTLNTTTRGRPYSTKLQAPAKITVKNKTPFTQKGKGACNSAPKQQPMSGFVQKETMAEKRIESQDRMESAENKYYDTDHEDPITVLRKEIQDWRINEILTARSEERFTGTPSYQRTYSYGMFHVNLILQH